MKINPITTLDEILACNPDECGWRTLPAPQTVGYTGPRFVPSESPEALRAQIDRARAERDAAIVGEQAAKDEAARVKEQIAQVRAVVK